MNDSAPRAYMTGSAVAYFPLVRSIDNPKLNFAKIRTLAKTEDGKIVEVNPHMKYVHQPVKRSVRLDDIMNLE